MRYPVCQLPRTLHSIEGLKCFKFLLDKLKDLEYSQQLDEDKNNFKGVILTISPIKVPHIEMVECSDTITDGCMVKGDIP